MIVDKLSMDTLGQPWRCKPIRTLKSETYQPGRKDVLAIAEQPPPKDYKRIQMGSSIVMVRIKIKEVTDRQKPSWDKIGRDSDWESKKQENPAPQHNPGSYAAAAARPKSLPPGRRARWADGLGADNLATDSSAAAATPMDQSTAEDDQEDDPRFVLFPNGSLPVTPKVSPLMQKLKEMQEEREAETRLNDQRMRAAEQSIIDNQRSTEQQLEALGTSLGEMQSHFTTTMSENSALQETRHKAALVSQRTMMAQMTKMMAMVKKLHPEGTMDDDDDEDDADSSTPRQRKKTKATSS
jgi:hypothetical protein